MKKNKNFIAVRNRIRQMRKKCAKKLSNFRLEKFKCPCKNSCELSYYINIAQQCVEKIKNETSV